MGIKYTKSSKNSDNVKSASSVPMKPKKKRRWLPFSIKKKENQVATVRIKNSFRNSKRKLNMIRTSLDEVPPPQPPQVLAPKPGLITTMQDYEVQIIERIKLQLMKDSQAFMLNQLLLSTQFFGNFQREKEKEFADITMKEVEVSMKLSKHLKSVILADCLQNAVDKKVKYQASYGPIQGKFLSLDTHSVYIVCDNIEVTRADETESIYGVLPDPSMYKMVMEDHTDQARLRHSRISYKGYVKLRSVDFYDKVSREESSSGIGSISNEVVTVNPCKEDDDGVKLYEDDEKFECESMYSVDATSVKSIRGIRDASSGKSVCIINGLPFSASTSNETSRGSSEYDYAYITAVNAHKPFGSFVSMMNEKLSSTVIPARCIASVVFDEDDKGDGHDSDDEDSDTVDGKDTASTLKEEPVYQLEVRQYLSSKEFFAYFSNIFLSKIGPELGYNDKTIQKATYKGATICIPFCGKSYEITPAIQCPWPNEAHEWDKRMREAIENPLTKKTYQWPTQNMINIVMEMGCHVIPVGFAPKRGKNLDREIEWKIVFPLAERYLEQQFNGAQAKIYMILKVLMRAFVDPFLGNGENMFTKEHLRAFMFWQCEENPMAWNEDCLGEKLLKVLACLLNHIQTQSLPDYFLPKRNLFENVPERNLISVLTRLSWICERPMNYLLICLRDLKYLKQFYPKIRSLKVYNTLIIKDPLLKLNPILDSSTFGSSDEVKPAEAVLPATRKLSEAVGSMAEIEKMNLKQARVKPSSKKMRHTANRLQQRAVAPVPPKPNHMEVINVKINLCRRMEPARQRLLFDLFIPHFIEMSQYALQNELAIHVAQMSIRQAERLSRILYEQDDKGQQYLDQIEPVKRAIEVLVRQVKKEGPRKPRRGSITGPITTRPRSMGPRNSSMMEDPYVNLTKIMHGMATVAETPDDDAKGTLKASPPKQRPPLTIAAHVHVDRRITLEEAEQITAENIIDNAFKRQGLTPGKTPASEDVRLRA